MLIKLGGAARPAGGGRGLGRGRPSSLSLFGLNQKAAAGGRGPGRGRPSSPPGRLFIGRPAGRRMPPYGPCPNCGQDEWLASDGLHYMPRVVPDDRGGYTADARNGVHVRVWRCNNCMYIMAFWEPD